MRENWTYKKLGEVCEIKTGKLDANAANENGKYPFFTCSKEPMSINTYAYDCECVLIAGNGDLNVKYYNGKFNAYQRTYILSLKEKIDDVTIPYIYEFFLLYVDELRRKSIGGIIKYIKLGDLVNAKLPIPPLSEQQAIVAELDKINELISLKKAQLDDLDALAQSIFYDMFGDPIENEKGWEVKKLGEVCESDLGKTLNSAKDQGFLYPYLCAINILWNHIDLSTLKTTKFDDCELERYTVRKGDLLICEGGDIGRAAIWNKDETILYQNALHRVRFKNDIIPMYCLYYIWKLKQIGVLDGRYGKGVTIKHLVKSSLMSIPIPLPPLSLQQDFAKRVELIEQQKAQISSTIKDLETLLASRMQYWFD